MDKFLSQYKKNTQGSTAVEFALIAVPFLLLIFGVVESGRMIWTMNGIRYAIEETSRYASINLDAPVQELYDYAEVNLEGMLIESDPLQLTTSTWTSNGTDFVEVQARYEYATMFSALLPNEYGIVDFETVSRKPVLN
jgi:Flp pilus assembly pilin Flp